MKLEILKNKINLLFIDHSLGRLMNFTLFPISILSSHALAQVWNVWVAELNRNFDLFLKQYWYFFLLIFDFVKAYLNKSLNLTSNLIWTVSPLSVPHLPVSQSTGNRGTEPTEL